MFYHVNMRTEKRAEAPVKTKEKSVGARIPLELKHRLQMIAKSERRSVSQVILMCIETHLPTLEAKRLDSFRTRGANAISSVAEKLSKAKNSEAMGKMLDHRERIK